MPHLRNIQTGAIKVVDDGPEFEKLKGERTDDGRFPLWEQTSAGDADPENSDASSYEVEHRARWGVKPLSDVTTDGVGQSDKAVASDKTVDTDPPSGGTAPAKTTAKR